MSYPRPVRKPIPSAEAVELPWLSWKLATPTPPLTKKPLRAAGYRYTAPEMFPTVSVTPFMSLVQRFTSPPTRTRGLGVPPSLSAAMRPPPLAPELKLQPPLQLKPFAPYPSPKAPQNPPLARRSCAQSTAPTHIVRA